MNALSLTINEIKLHVQFCLAFTEVLSLYVLLYFKGIFGYLGFLLLPLSVLLSSVLEKLGAGTSSL